jgi:CHAT domain-containing protein
MHPLFNGLAISAVLAARSFLAPASVYGDDAEEFDRLSEQCRAQQEKWQSPYYWGTFVLVGPN